LKRFPGFLLAVTLIATGTALTGCADPPMASDRSVELSQLQSGTGQVEALEQQCADDAIKRSDVAIAQVVATPDASIDGRMQSVVDQRSRELAQCESDADQQNEKLSEGERDDYAREADEQRQRTAMAILVTSKP
jgi:hypothetical protein